ncbi:MAG: ferritin-like domain-containing protein [Bacteroidota bacterium]
MKATAKKTASRAQAQSMEYGMEESSLMRLFEDELKDIYWAEKALTKALPKLIKNATAPELANALRVHLKETEYQVANVEKVFKLIDKKVQAKKCEAMDGLIREAQGIMEDTEKGAMRDAGIISAAQKVEHYEIATYGTLRTFAQILGLNNVVEILETILLEEKTADETLTEVAESINILAAQEAW